MSLKSNVAANYFGQGWQALMNFAFVPIYIKYLRVEAYGLIGIFAFLQAWLVLLDMGLKPALGREMARFTAGAHDVQSIRDLLRSVELIGIAIAIAISLGIWAASGWLATHWVTAKHIPVEVVAHAFALMGLVAALRFLQDIYVSGSIGLQRQVPQNIVISITATLRGLGRCRSACLGLSHYRSFFSLASCAFRAYRSAACCCRLQRAAPSSTGRPLLWGGPS